MHSENPPFLNTGTLPVVHIKFSSNVPYMLFTRKPGQITRHPYEIETLIERQTQVCRGVTFEVSLEKDILTKKPQQITQHMDIRGKKRATYMLCKLQLVG